MATTTERQVTETIRKLKDCKAPGNYNINNEMLNYRGIQLTRELTKLLQ